MDCPNITPPAAGGILAPISSHGQRRTMTRPAQRRVNTPSEIIEQLAQLHGLLHDDGRVNYSAMSRRTGIATSTISRIHRGTRDAQTGRSEEWVLSSDTIRRLMSAFHLTFAEASGQAPLPKPGQKRKRAGAGRYEPTPADLELLRALRSLSEPAQREVQALLDIKAQLEHAKRK